MTFQATDAAKRPLSIVPAAVPDATDGLELNFRFAPQMGHQYVRLQA